MEYTTLGSTGIRVSQLCFGTWRFGSGPGDQTETGYERAHELLDAAWENGINFIDTANVYGEPNGTSERWIGEWLDDYDREDFVISSKVYYPFDEAGVNSRGLSRPHIRKQIEGTLDRLDTDYLDVYYVHAWDEATKIEETLSTLSWLVEEGKVNYLGVSNVAAWQLTKALWKSDVGDLERFEIAQPRYNAVFKESVADYLDVCDEQNLAVCPYSPLEGGFLTGKYERKGSPPSGSRGDLHDWNERFPPRFWRVLEEIRSVADERDATSAQVALRWLVEHDRFTCVPVVGARTTEQLEENVESQEISFRDRDFERIVDSWSDDEAES